MHYIDTHFHLDLWGNPKLITEKIERSQIYTIAVTNTPSVFNFTYDLLKDKKYIRPALGLHPELVYQRAGELPLFFDKISQTRYIGEIGLDFSGRNIQSKELQMEIFEKIIDICSEYGDKILTIHSRRAEKAVVEMIGQNFPGKAILHWYSGSLQTLKKAVEYGFYFSVNDRMIGSTNGKRIIDEIPIDRLLTESDGPFIEVADKKNNPLLIPSTLKKLAELKAMSDEKLNGLIYGNFKKLLI